MAKQTGFFTSHTPKTLLVAVDAPYNEAENITSYIEEFISLAKTNGLPLTNTHTMKIRTVDPSYFFTEGKLTELQVLCEQLQVEEVILSEALTAQQERNIRDFLKCVVKDRTQLILEIFQKAAHSAEGKLQVAIALLQHKKTRLAGKGINLSQQAGFTGVRGGPGETAKERERRHIDNEINKLNEQLDRLELVRATQRKQRQESGIPHLCIIGYTNAGKSTLLNTLTKSTVLVENKLFATLDTTTRSLYHDQKKVALISDTVGFIQQLPHQLIEAFKSTLAELHYADLLLHVIDLSDKNWQSHIRTVHAILNELSVQKDIMYVFNKADKVEDLASMSVQIAQYNPHVIVSALDKSSLQQLRTTITSWNMQHPHTHGITEQIAQEQ